MAQDWSSKNPHVKRLLKFIEGRYRRGKKIDAEELVAWDERNGKNLFEWDDETAAAAQRVHQARMFMNRFSALEGGNRVRAWLNVAPADGAEEPRAYYPMPAVLGNESLRSSMISNVTQRLQTQAMTLQFLNLTPEEQARILRVVEAAIRKELTNEQRNHLLSESESHRAT